MPSPSEDPLLKSARREATAALLFWVLMILVTLVVCYVFGYVCLEPRTKPAFLLGFPFWVFWGIMVPWAACIGFGSWFAYRFMKDEDLGGEKDGPDGD